MRGSSVHFKRIASAMQAVSHASREVPPEYLLPENMSLGTHVVIDDHGQVQKLLEHKMQLASRQAKATKDYSPMWEGVINLPEPSKDITPKRQVEIIKEWCLEYEKMTGHKVIRADVHLDEGYLDEAGKPHYNAHAHVMCDRTDDKGKVKKLTSTVLREVQNMTANVTTLQRGLDARTTGRRHINHHNFKFDAEKNRLALEGEKAKTEMVYGLVDSQNVRAKQAKEDLKQAKSEAAKAQLVADEVPQLQAQLDGEPARLDAALKAQEAQLKEQYRLDREALETKYKDDRAEYKSSTEKKTQQDYKDLKTAHLGELETLAKAHASELETLKTKLAEAQQQADRVPDLVATVAQLTPVAGQVPDLKTKLAKADAQAGKVPELAAAAVRLQAQLDGEPARLAVALEQEKYRLERAEYKRLNAEAVAAGLEKPISQKDYQALKVKFDAAIAALNTQNQKVEKMDAKIATLAVENAQLKEAIFQAVTQTDALQKAAIGHREATENLREQVAKLTDENAKLASDRARFAAMAKEYQEEKARGTPAHLIDPTPRPGLNTKLTVSPVKVAATPPGPLLHAGGEGRPSGLPVVPSERAGQPGVSTASLHGVAPHTPIQTDVQRLRQRLQTATEQPKTKNPDIPSHKPQKSLQEALAASWEAMLKWIQSIGGKREEVTESSYHRGPVTELDDLHCVQKTGRVSYAIHRLDDLDMVPQVGQDVVEVKYRDGVGHVSGGVHRPKQIGG